MKKYQSHKIVHGGLIIGVEVPGNDSVIIHVQGENKPFKFNETFIARGTPVKNESYLVLYNAGTDKEYYAHCPKDIFEEGNHPADEDEPTVELKIDDIRVLQQISDDALSAQEKLIGGDHEKHHWQMKGWYALAEAANYMRVLLLDENHGYECLEQAIADGESVERCMINQHGGVEEWNRVDEIDRRFHPDRYRIASDDSESHSEAS